MSSTSLGHFRDSRLGIHRPIRHAYACCSTGKGIATHYPDLKSSQSISWESLKAFKVSTVKEMQDLDYGATKKYGVPSILLMESAGIASFRVLCSHFSLERGTKLLVFAGPGNNGGDGYVVARHALAAGADVRVVVMANPDKYKADAKTNYDAAEQLGIQLESLEESPRDQVSTLLSWADVVVDAIFGVGLAREVSGRFLETIQAINEWGGPVLALDIPSGVQGDTGEVLGEAVRAEATITYGVPKLGNMLYPGYQLGGKLYTTRISFPPWHDSEVKVEISRPSPLLQPRNPDGHKGSFGQALFVAGANGYYGAPRLASLAFLKAGGGYSRLATPESIVPFLAATAGSVVYIPLPETDKGSISPDGLEKILSASKKQDAMIIGPGLSIHPQTANLVLELIRKPLEMPIVLDGDALTFIANAENLKPPLEPRWILTPHLGELARLLGKSVAEVKGRLVECGRETALKYNAVIVVKGAHTLIVSPMGDIRINPTGNSGMGTAGSGDVLTGCIAAMLAMGLPVFDAAVSGVFLHGMAGDVASELKGEDGMIADDILESVPEAMRRLRDPSRIPTELFASYCGPETI